MKKLLLAGVLMLSAWPAVAQAEVAKSFLDWAQHCENPETGAGCAKLLPKRLPDCSNAGDEGQIVACMEAADKAHEASVRFRPWQQVWQCNDIRVTVTE